MFTRIAKSCPALILAFALVSAPATAQTASGDGIVRVKSAHSMEETIARLKKDIADKGITFFLQVEQSRLAAEAGIKVPSSTLLIFGNPPLGTQFLKAKPQAGIDWPVRLLVQQDEKGDVWAIYTDFLWIARRHGITEADQAPFKTASGVIASITSSVKAR
ncbi:MAG TPA: DUF302 domain-containing protein [Burkholderiales bacterium]|nr:DUF302 domain-containing protein [Burkholderiales bacterium]